MGINRLALTSSLALLLVAASSVLGNEVEDATKLLQSKGLTKVGAVFELDVDARLAERLRAIRAAESQLSSYGRKHQAVQNDVNHATATLDDLARQMVDVDQKMERTDKNAYATYNALANQHNKLLGQLREGENYRTARLDELNKLVAPPAPTNLTISLATDIDSADSKYTTLAADSEIKKALETLSATGPRVKLGPSDLFTQQRQVIRHQRDVAMKAAIKGKLYHNTLQVSVTLNQSTIPMIVDSGCSTLLITDKVAKQAGIKVDLSAPTASATTANGAVVKVHPAKIPTLTVGQFTLKDISCDVLPAGVGDDCLLGGAFLQHFLYQIDLSAAALNLTPLDTGITTAKTADEPTTKPTPSVAPSIVAATPSAADESLNDNSLFQSTLVGTVWRWTPTETIEFNPDGTVTNSSWSGQGLTTSWKVIDRRTVLLFIESGRNDDRYAILTFNPDASAYSAYGFHGDPPTVENHRVGSR